MDHFFDIILTKRRKNLLWWEIVNVRFLLYFFIIKDYREVPLKSWFDCLASRKGVHHHTEILTKISSNHWSTQIFKIVIFTLLFTHLEHWQGALFGVAWTISLVMTKRLGLKVFRLPMRSWKTVQDPLGSEEHVEEVTEHAIVVTGSSGNFANGSEYTIMTSGIEWQWN